MWHRRPHRRNPLATQLDALKRDRLQIDAIKKENAAIQLRTCFFLSPTLLAKTSLPTKPQNLSRSFLRSYLDDDAVRNDRVGEEEESGRRSVVGAKRRFESDWPETANDVYGWLSTPRQRERGDSNWGTANSDDILALSTFACATSGSSTRCTTGESVGGGSTAGLPLKTLLETDPNASVDQVLEAVMGGGRMGVAGMFAAEKSTAVVPAARKCSTPICREGVKKGVVEAACAQLMRIQRRYERPVVRCMETRYAETYLVMKGNSPFYRPPMTLAERRTIRAEGGTFGGAILSV